MFKNLKSRFELRLIKTIKTNASFRNATIDEKSRKITLHFGNWIIFKYFHTQKQFIAIWILTERYKYTLYEHNILFSGKMYNDADKRHKGANSNVPTPPNREIK